MAYPDLPPGLTFWRCPNCGNETLFRAAGLGHIECGQCHQVLTVQQLKGVHARAHAQPVTS